MAAERRVLAAGAGAVVVVAVVALLTTGVGLWELVRYGAYLCAFVLAPGIAAYLALTPRPGDPVRVLSLGWALGSALVLASFALTAALGVRGLLWAHPVVVLGLAVPAARHRVAAIAWADAPGPRAVAAGAGVLAVAIAYLVLDPFVATPLPDAAASVEYYPDLVFDIGLVAEAMHHWPPQNPSVAGEPLRYHIFAFLDMAATANVTGVEAATLVLRLFPLSLTVLSLLLMACLGRAVGRRWSVGVLAGALLFLAGELDLFARVRFPFAGVFHEVTWASPTYMFGLPFFLAAVLLVCDLLAGRVRPASRHWPLFVTMAAVAAGAKASAVAVLIGGLVITAAWCVVFRRRRVPALLGLAGVVVAIYVVAYVVLYSGGTGALTLGPFDFLRYTQLGTRIPSLSDRIVLEALLAGPTLLAAYFALAGVAWAIWRRRLTLEAVFLLALLAASLVPSLILVSPGMSQMYFLLYGIPPGLVVAAVGLERFWGWATDLGVRPRRLVAAGAAALAVAAAAAAWSWTVDDVTSLTPVLVVYGVALIAVVVAAAAIAPRPLRARVVAPIAVALAVALTLADRPLDGFPPRLKALKDGVPMHAVDQPEARGTTRALTAGLRWVRDHTSPDALLAVNVHLRQTAADSRYFYFSALTERRVYLESWAYTPEGAERDASPDPVPRAARGQRSRDRRREPGRPRAAAPSRRRLPARRPASRHGLAGARPGGRARVRERRAARLPALIAASFRTPMKGAVKLSVVVPVYRCTPCLAPLHGRLCAVLDELVGGDFELILVDDRGGQGAWEAISALAAEDARVRGVRLSRNFGQHAAITAGLAAARGDHAVVMDCDLQDPPEVIPRFYAEAMAGHDVVYGRRRSKPTSFLRRLSARLYFAGLNVFTGAGIQGEFGSFSLISRKVIDGFLRFRDEDRHYILILHWLGFDWAAVDYEPSTRYAGKSSYSFGALIRHGLDGMFFQTTVLLRWIVYFGFALASLGALLATYFAVARIVGSAYPGWTSIAVILLLASGFIITSTGITGLYVGKVFEQVKGRPLYVIDRETPTGVERAAETSEVAR